MHLFAFADRSMLKVGDESLPGSPGALAPQDKGGLEIEGPAACRHRLPENFTQQVFLQKILFCLLIGIKLRVKCMNHNCVVCWVFDTGLHLCKSYSNRRQGAPLTQEGALLTWELPCVLLLYQASPPS